MDGASIQTIPPPSIIWAWTARLMATSPAGQSKDLADSLPWSWWSWKHEHQRVREGWRETKWCVWRIAKIYPRNVPWKAHWLPSETLYLQVLPTPGKLIEWTTAWQVSWFSSAWEHVTRFGVGKCARCLRVLGPGCGDKFVPEARPGWKGKVRTKRKSHLPLSDLIKVVRMDGDLSPKPCSWGRDEHHWWALSLNWTTLYLVTVTYGQMHKPVGLGWSLSFHVPGPRETEHLQGRAGVSQEETDPKLSGREQLTLMERWGEVLPGTLPTYLSIPLWITELDLQWVFSRCLLMNDCLNQWLNFWSLLERLWEK